MQDVQGGGSAAYDDPPPKKPAYGAVDEPGPGPMESEEKSTLLPESTAAAPEPAEKPQQIDREMVLAKHGLMAGILLGCITIIVQEMYFYIHGGCSAEREAREDWGHQISNQMCCDGPWVISSIGLTLTSICCSLAVPTVWRQQKAFGYCCCASGVSLSAAIAVAFGMLCVGLAVLSIFQMCWVIEMHAIGAFMFFVGGFSCICMANIGIRTPRSGNDWVDATPTPEDLPLTESLASKAVRWGALVTFLVAFPLYAAGYGYTGEWFMVAAIALFVFYAYLTLDSKPADYESLTLDLDTKETQIAETNPSSSP